MNYTANVEVGRDIAGFLRIMLNHIKITFKISCGNTVMNCKVAFLNSLSIVFHAKYLLFKYLITYYILSKLNKGQLLSDRRVLASFSEVRMESLDKTFFLFTFSLLSSF